ncbi:MAG: FAD-dependent oxidoreductase [Proteobacteria bacterium]|nr:FAD-dependent oxidoreductase [Pseudomonadota bacterium]
MHVTVVGAGVIGLTTTLVLESLGHTVRVVARATGEATTSAVAGAVWFPYRAGPPQLVAAWAARTRAWLVELAANAATGVDVLEGYEIEPGTGHEPPELPWWAVDLPEVTRVAAPCVGAPLAWRFVAPRVTPATFLPWLTSQLRATIELRSVTDLTAEPGDLVVNCTGLGARVLCNDDQLQPLLGQIVVTRPGAAHLGRSLTDDRDPDAIFYIIPRRDELVLGGCAIPTDELAGEDPAITARILAHARRLGLDVGDVLRVRIIHNYGHGGAGYTLARGCAEAVAQLI